MLLIIPLGKKKTKQQQKKPPNNSKPDVKELLWTLTFSHLDKVSSKWFSSMYFWRHLCEFLSDK